MSNINDTLLDAIDLVVTSRINEMKFDKTIVCTITAVGEGECQVSYQNSKFNAVANEKYKVGQKVLVTTTQDGVRFIAGACASDNATVYNYTLPENRVVLATNNLITQSSTALPTRPDGSLSSARTISTTFNNINFNYGFDFELKYILLKVDFSALFEDEEAIGKYGLNLYINNELYGALDSDHFYGNPYQSDMSSQQILFKMPNVENINDLYVQLYASGFETTKSIYADNIEVYFCYDKEDIAAGATKLAVHTKNNNVSLDYKDAVDVELAAKLLNNRKLEDLTSDNLAWFQYQLGYNPYNGLSELEMMAGTNWKYLGGGSEITIKTIPYFAQTNIKACWYEYDETNIPVSNQEAFIVFSNTEKVVDVSGAEAAASGDTRTKLKINDDNSSLFFVYGHDGQSVRSTEFTITPYFADGNIPDNGKVSLFFPKTGSQIIAPVEDLDEDGNNLGVHTKDDLVWIYSETDTEVIISYEYETEFPTYRAQYYDTNYYRSNNTIRCEIDQAGGPFYTQRTLTFGNSSSSGTNYRLNLVCLNDSWAFAPWASAEGQTRRFKISLEDNSGNDLKTVLQDNLDKISIKVLNVSNFITDSYTAVGEDLTFEVKLSGTNVPQYAMKDNYMVLQVQVSEIAVINNNKAVTLTCKYPVALRWGDIISNAGYNYDYAQRMVGATRVIYDNSGNYPTYDDSKYQIFSGNEPIGQVRFMLNGDTNFLSLENGALKPSYTLRTTKEIKANIYAYIPNGTYEWPLWSQTIMVDSISYMSDLINSWDGAVVDIDGENGTILSQFVGAGTKDEHNIFSGVLMGAVGLNADSNQTAKTGLYGYREGQLRFKFDENGNAYIGNGNDQYIEFNNGSLKIKSNEFYLHSDNLLITSSPDLDTENSVFIYRQSKDADPFFRLNPVGWSTLAEWRIAKDSIFHLSESALEGAQSGAGMYGGTSQTLPAFWAGYKSQTEPPTETSWNTFDKPNFYVTHKGYLSAKEAQIGNAQIADWSIESEKISNGIATLSNEGLHIESVGLKNFSFFKATYGNFGLKYDNEYHSFFVTEFILSHGNYFGLSTAKLRIGSMVGDDSTMGMLVIGEESDLYIEGRNGKAAVSLREILNMLE